MSGVRAHLTRPTEEILLYVEGRPGVLRKWVVDHLDSCREARATMRLLYRAEARGLIEPRMCPDGVRVWLTTAGLGLLHGTAYANSAPAEVGEWIPPRTAFSREAARNGATPNCYGGSGEH